MGLQASGKSSFYLDRFYRTHIRINLDMLRTRHREQRLLEVCLSTQQPFVVDNTNPMRNDRQVYIETSKNAGFRISGYYFESKLQECLRRNDLRQGSEKIPIQGVLSTSRKLELPRFDEGFDELYYVRMVIPVGFQVEGWSDGV
ncbi:MAG: AAA family ATPase [Gemmataceae bacterium]